MRPCVPPPPPPPPSSPYYVMLPGSGVPEGTPEVTQAATDAAFLRRYLNDFRFLLLQIGCHRAFVHLEPDFRGYAQHAARARGGRADALPAPVSAANPEDSDFVVVDIADRDAGWRRSVGQDTWIQVTATLPSYDQARRRTEGTSGRAPPRCARREDGRSPDRPGLRYRFSRECLRRHRPPRYAHGGGRERRDGG